MYVAYGHRIVSNDDPYLKIAEDVNHLATHSGPIGGTPVDMFPFRMSHSISSCGFANTVYSKAFSQVVPRGILCWCCEREASPGNKAT